MECEGGEAEGWGWISYFQFWREGLNHPGVNYGGWATIHPTGGGVYGRRGRGYGGHS